MQAHALLSFARGWGGKPTLTVPLNELGASLPIATIPGVPHNAAELVPGVNAGEWRVATTQPFGELTHLGGEVGLWIDGERYTLRLGYVDVVSSAPTYGGLVLRTLDAKGLPADPPPSAPWGASFLIHGAAPARLRLLSAFGLR